MIRLGVSNKAPPRAARYLQRNDLAGSIPPELGGLQNLEHVENQSSSSRVPLTHGMNFRLIVHRPQIPLPDRALGE